MTNKEIYQNSCKIDLSSEIEKPEIRLIDANALKEEINNLAIPIYEKMVLKAIDNTPTVETHDTVNMYCDKDTQIIVEQIRPKGEWEFDGEDILKGSIFKCSVCGERSCCKGNFCPDCGARMKGGVK